MGSDAPTTELVILLHHNSNDRSEIDQTITALDSYTDAFLIIYVDALTSLDNHIYLLQQLYNRFSRLAIRYTTKSDLFLDFMNEMGSQKFRYLLRYQIHVDEPLAPLLRQGVQSWTEIKKAFLQQPGLGMVGAPILSLNSHLNSNWDVIATIKAWYQQNPWPVNHPLWTQTMHPPEELIVYRFPGGFTLQATNDHNVGHFVAGPIYVIRFELAQQLYQYFRKLTDYTHQPAAIQRLWGVLTTAYGYYTLSPQWFNQPPGHSPAQAHYEHAKDTPSDIFQHLETLYKYTKECDSVLECGVRDVVSSWAFLWGLVEGRKDTRYTACDINRTSGIDHLELVASQYPVKFQFIKNNDLDLPNEEYDLTFIDTWHVYAQLKRELAKFAPLTRKYIIMHDTEVDKIGGESVRERLNIAQQAQATGWSETEISLGLGPAIEEFLVAHPEWYVKEVFTHNNGLTVLARRHVEDAPVKGEHVEREPVEDAPVKGERVECGLVGDAPVKREPAKGEPVETQSVEDTPLARLAIFYTGQVRSMTQTMEYFRTNLVENNYHADVFACLDVPAEARTSSEEYLRSQLGTHLVSLDFHRPTSPDWALQRQCHLLHLPQLTPEWRQYLLTSGSMLEHYQVWRAWQAMLKWEQQHQMQYDFVMRIRPDNIWTAPLSLDWYFRDPNEWLPTYAKWEDSGLNKNEFWQRQLCFLLRPDLINRTSTISTRTRVAESDDLWNELMEAEGPYRTVRAWTNYLLDGQYILTLRANHIWFARRRPAEVIPYLAFVYGQVDTTGSDNFYFNSENQFTYWLRQNSLSHFDCCSELEDRSIGDTNFSRSLLHSDQLKEMIFACLR